MSEEPATNNIDDTMLACAFPKKHTVVATAAANEVVRNLDRRYWWGQFDVEVDGESVQIPVRLHFAFSGSSLSRADEAFRFARALHTRSTDGFERQRAARDLLSNFEPWAAPFIVALIGEYLVEIVEDICTSMTPELERELGSFIVNNKAFWITTKSRITSYWNAYYRTRCASQTRTVHSRDDYVGFAVIKWLETAAFGYARQEGK